MSSPKPSETIEQSPPAASPHQQTPSQEWLSKRVQVGCVAAISLISALVLFIMNPGEAALPSVMLRVGTIMGALWLAMPVIGRVRRWIELMPSFLAMGIPICIAVPHFRILIPILLIIAGISWWSRKKPPRSR